MLIHLPVLSVLHTNGSEFKPLQDQESLILQIAVCLTLTRTEVLNYAIWSEFNSCKIRSPEVILRNGIKREFAIP
jgi:hypothetical protein